MKKLIALTVLLLLLSVALYADISKMFVVTKPIMKIYTGELGFRVVYIKNDLTLGEFYVPIDWFGQSNGKGIMIKGIDDSYPYFSVFWYEGKFHSIKIYAKGNLADETWGSLQYRDGLDAKFDVDEIVLDL